MEILQLLNQIGFEAHQIRFISLHIQFKNQFYMSSIQKDSYTQETMASSSPACLTGSVKGINTSQTESSNKSSTKLPPLVKNKSQESSDVKQNLKSTLTALSSSKKIFEDPNAPSFKKIKNISKKKIIQKKKKNMVTAQLQEKYTIYRQFLSLVNLSNNIEVLHESQIKYTLFVGKGNNSPLIRQLFRTYRPWWKIEETNPNNPDINLHWHQLRQTALLESMRQTKKTEQDFQNCGIFVQQKQEQQGQNKEEKDEPKQILKEEKRTQSNLRSHSVTMKDRQFSKHLATTMKRSSSRIKSGSTEKIVSPLKYNLKKQIKEELEEDKKKKKTLANPKMWPIYHNFRRIMSTHEMKQLKKLHVLKEDGKVHGKLGRNKVKVLQNKSNNIVSHNHLCNNWNLSNKKALFMNLKTYYESKKENPFLNIPMTFHIKEKHDKQFDIFLQEYNKRNEQIREEEKSKKSNSNNQIKYGFKPKRRNAWLVKPGENTNRGNGIVVVQTLEQINTILEKDTEGKKGQQRTHIIQEYIIPFLYQKRKFDIRSYILITSVNGYLKGYWYQDGYIRTACKQFNMKNLANRFIHLTNDAVQKYHEDYGKFQPGNKLSFADFQRYLDSAYNNNEGQPKLKFWNQAYPQMKKLAADAIRATFTHMDKNKKQYSFEVFGLDFLIDENFKVWLIEANTNPCLELSCPLLGRLIPGMLQNAFKIIVDPLFPPPDVEEIAGFAKKLPLNDNLIECNKFELIFDQAQEGKQLKTLLGDAPDLKIYDIQQEEQQFQD